MPARPQNNDASLLEDALSGARLWQLQADAGYRRGRLVTGWLLSLALHATLLALLFLKLPPASTYANSTIEVSLVNAYSEAIPEHAQLLAQHALEGGGIHDEAALASSPLPRTTTQTASEQFLAALRKRQQSLEQEQQSLLLQLQSLEMALADSKAPAQNGHTSATGGDDDADADAVLLNARIHALKKEIVEYNARPRTHFVGPSAKAAVYAEYVEAWRRKIEAIGTGHYPAHAGQKLYGQLQMTVYIRADGELDRIHIDQPSTQAALNLAARRIVQLAAPFAPLPEAMQQETDVLAITRTWHFTNEQLSMESP